MVIERNSLEDPNRCGASDSFAAETNDVRAYWDCMSAIYGEDPLLNPGPACVHDEDCVQYGAKCSIRSKRCLIPLDTSEQLFMGCLYDNLTQFTRNYITRSLGIATNATNASTLWKQGFTQMLNCSDPYSPVGYATTSIVTGRCTFCGSAYKIPFPLTIVFQYAPGPNVIAGGQDCWNGPTECVYTNLPVTAASFCATAGCTSNPFIPFSLFGPAACAGASYCAVYDDFYAVDVTSIMPVVNCDGSQYICVLANGTKIVTPDEATCTNTMSCTVPCNGAACTDEGACTGAGKYHHSSSYHLGIHKSVFFLRNMFPRC